MMYDIPECLVVFEGKVAMVTVYSQLDECKNHLRVGTLVISAKIYMDYIN